MSVAYFLIGLPASGKSTWRAAYLAQTSRPTVVISSDDMIDEYALEHGITYTEAFKQVSFTELERKMDDRMRAAVAAGDDIIIDRTNMTRKSRGRFLRMLPASYLKKAIVFKVPRDELNRRLEARAKTGKVIADHVIDNMASTFVSPEPTEFDDIEFYPEIR